MTSTRAGAKAPSAAICQRMAGIVDRGIAKDWEEYHAGKAALAACGVTLTFNEIAASNLTLVARTKVAYLQKLDSEHWHEGFSAPDELSELSQQWETLAERIKDLRARAAALQIDGWVGPGADGYRATIPNFEKASEEITKLSKHMASVDNSTSKHVRTTNIRYMLLLGTIVGDLRSAAAAPVNTNWPSRNFFERLIGSKGGGANFQFQFFTRSSGMAQTLSDGMQQVQEFGKKSEPDYDAFEVTADMVSDLSGPHDLHGFTSTGSVALVETTEDLHAATFSPTDGAGNSGNNSSDEDLGSIETSDLRTGDDAL